MHGTGDNLDAYSRLLRSLHYLGRIAIIERGYYPEVMVWSQVKRIDPEVYKLYEELIRSTEETEKRVALMLIAIEFSINSRLDSCAEHLMELLSTREEPWGFGEIKTLPEVEPYTYNLVSLIEYLVGKDKISVVLEKTKGNQIYHRKYQVKK